MSSRHAMLVAAVLTAAFLPTLQRVEVPGPAPLTLNPTLAGASTVAGEHSYAFASDRTALEAAIELFNESGLGTPTFRAMFHSSPEPCRGHGGMHATADDGSSIAHVCVYYVRPSLRERARANTLLHEMAHAWISQNVAQEQINSFMEIRGLEVWNALGVPWEKHGAEHAAEILLWGITDGSRHINVKMGETDRAILEPAYAALTVWQPAP